VVPVWFGGWALFPPKSGTWGEYANHLRGFWSGFTSTTAEGEYGFLVPHFDGVAYSGLAARIDLKVSLRRAFPRFGSDAPPTVPLQFSVEVPNLSPMVR
jgi:hypothetical protein